MTIIRHRSPPAAARVRIDQDRRRSLERGFRWRGVDFQIDEGSLGRIARRVGRILAARQLGRPPEPVTWWDRDNVEHRFTEEEFLELAIAVDEHVERVARLGRERKGALGALPDVAGEGMP